MADKDEILKLMLRECDLCIHLHGKIPAGGMDFRFTPAQRSTKELLRYLSFIGLAVVRCMAEGNWDAYGALLKQAESLEPAGFPAAMEKQKQALRAQFAEMKASDLATKRFDMPWGESAPIGEGILSLGYASLVAYRMQLFLQAKAAGASSIGTSNCWGGKDAAPKA